MDIRLSYNKQRPYYEGFTFFPIKGARRYNHFIFKVYNSNINLNGVLNTEYNKEALDTNYIIAIRRKITTYSIPQTQVVMTHMESTHQSLLELLSNPYHDEKPLLRALDAVHLLERSVHAFKEAQHRLRSELKLLLSSKGFVNLCSATAEDIDVINVKWQQMSDEIERVMRRLMEFNRVTVPPADQDPVLTAQIQVGCLVLEMRKILQMKGMIIHLLYGWKALRQQHEAQELYN